MPSGNFIITQIGIFQMRKLLHNAPFLAKRLFFSSPIVTLGLMFFSYYHLELNVAQIVQIIILVLSHTLIKVKAAGILSGQLPLAGLYLFELAFLTFSLPTHLRSSFAVIFLFTLPFHYLLQGLFFRMSLLTLFGALFYLKKFHQSQVEFELVLIYIFIAVTITNHSKSKDASSSEILSPDIKPTKPRLPSMVLQPDDTIDSSEEPHILGISHDCRNLLNSLMACLNIMKHHDPKLAENIYHQSALSTSEVLTDLMEQLLHKMMRQEMSEEPKNTSIPDLLEKLWILESPAIKEKNLRGSFKIETGTPLNVNICERSIRQVLLNLIGNSIKFADKGGITLKVGWLTEDEHHEEKEHHSQSITLCHSLTEHEGTLSRLNSIEELNEIPKFKQIKSVSLSPNILRENPILAEINFSRPKFDLSPTLDDIDKMPSKRGTLVFKLIDNGCGMRKDSIPEIFKKFSQVHPNQKKRRLGFGIGLWYAKHLVDQMNGTIELDSHLNIGTTTTIKIPCDVVPPQEVEAQKPKRILILESDHMTKLFLKIYFYQMGAEVTSPDPETSEIENLIFDNYSLIFCSDSLYLQTSVKVIFPPEKLVIIEDDVLTPEAQIKVNPDKTLKKPLKLRDMEEILAKTHAFNDSIKGKEHRIKGFILAADDDPFCLSYLASEFQQKGLPCLMAKNGQEALDLFNKFCDDITLVVTDSNMPKLTGLELSKKIREVKSTQEVKIVVLTGYDSEDFISAARASGVDKVLVKPLRHSTLAQILKLKPH